MAYTRITLIALAQVVPCMKHHLKRLFTTWNENIGCRWLVSVLVVLSEGMSEIHLPLIDILFRSPARTLLPKENDCFGPYQ